MLKLSIDLLGLRWNRRAFGISFVRFLLWLRSVLKANSPEVDINFDQLRSVNQLPLSSEVSFVNDSRALFVVTQKDFRTLPLAISYLSKTTGIRLKDVDVVSPERYMIECKDVLQANGLLDCNIINENLVVPLSELATLREKSFDRFGWIYQQLLKIYSCAESEVKYTLICDADTILLNKRKWQNQSSSVLLPSLEFNQEYYLFLNRAFGFTLSPQFSFVAHHMLINNSMLRTFLEESKISNLKSFVSILEEKADFSNPSMMSIDYELYAQFMCNEHPSRIFMEKWSNINLTSSYFRLFEKSVLFRRFLSWNYQSVSFHSWS